MPSPAIECKKQILDKIRLDSLAASRPEITIARPKKCREILTT
jgi:hypothetical protein